MFLTGQKYEANSKTDKSTILPRSGMEASGHRKTMTGMRHALLLLIGLTCALALQSPQQRGAFPHNHGRAAAPPNLAPTEASSRRSVLARALAVPLAAAWPLAASAAKFEKGSKEEKDYNDCLSLCAYYCMKPKGQFTKSRMECLIECKPVCKVDAKTKFQG
jgi:hypothetical protein